MSWKFRLRAIEAHDPETDAKGCYKGRLTDKRHILKRGAAVFKDGVQASPDPMRVEDFCEDRKLIFIRCRGYSTHINRMVGSVYEPAKILVYEYVEQVKGNEINIMVELEPRFEFKLKGGKTKIEEWWDACK